MGTHRSALTGILQYVPALRSKTTRLPTRSYLLLLARLSEVLVSPSLEPNGRSLLRVLSRTQRVFTHTFSGLSTHGVHSSTTVGSRDVRTRALRRSAHCLLLQNQKMIPLHSPRRLARMSLRLKARRCGCQRILCLQLERSSCDNSQHCFVWHIVEAVKLVIANSNWHAPNSQIHACTHAF